LAGDAAVPAPAQHREEGRRRAWLVHEPRRELHEQASELRAESAGIRKERIQQRPGTLQALVVRDRARQLDREAEAGGYGGRPALVGGAPVRPVERRVDLHHVEARRVPGKRTVALAEEPA